jgi:hypothetical protein
MWHSGQCHHVIWWLDIISVLVNELNDLLHTVMFLYLGSVRGVIVSILLAAYRIRLSEADF